MQEQTGRVCKRLRSGNFYLADPDEAERFEFSPKSSCWCAGTVTVLGPDDILYSVDMCQPGRACFEARQQRAADGVGPLGRS